MKWGVKLAAERHPGATTETELACLERGEDVGVADLGLRLDEAKRLTAALQVEMARRSWPPWVSARAHARR